MIEHTLMQKIDLTIIKYLYSYVPIFMVVAGVAELGNSLFVIGGNDGTSFLNSCEHYDPLTNKWSYVPPMSRPRAGIGAAVVDGILYVAGMSNIVYHLYQHSSFL